jgi:CBS domain-containing protein
MTEFKVRQKRTQSEFEESYDDEREIGGAWLNEPIRNIPRKPLAVVTTHATVNDAVSAMNEVHSGCCLVTRDGKLVGIFTERDVLTKVAGRNLSLDAKVEQVMTRDPDTLPDSSTVAYAMRQMSVEGYRHIPLVDAERRPTGVIAVRDIVVWMSDLFPAEVMNLPPEPQVPKEADGG